MMIEEPTTKNDLGVDCISRKQAIDAFPDLLPNMGYNKKAIMEILQELPSVTPQPCEDAVSRQVVLDLIADYDLSIGQVVRGIHALPPVIPQPRKGHWIKGYTFPDGEYWKCDKCNELIKVKYPMYYCNNCGSDNSKGAEE